MRKLRHRPRPATLLLAAVVAIAQVGLGAFGLARADVTSQPDAADSSNAIDIVSVNSSHTRSGRFRYRVDAANGFARRNAPCLRIRTPRPDPAIYRICGDGAVVEEGVGATGASATVNRPRRSTILYTLGKPAIGDPSSHRWQVRVLDPDCPRGVCDAAPDSGWVTHRIHVSYEGWAVKFLREMDVRTCRNNRVVVLAWEANENTQAVFNPLATTHAMPGSWEFNSHGVENFISLAQGLDGTRETIENGYSIYGYGRIVRRLGRCAGPRRTADAIRDSRWCFGCSSGEYVTGIVPQVLDDYQAYASREISTAP